MCMYMLLHLVKMQNYHFQALSFPPEAVYPYMKKKTQAHVSILVSVVIVVSTTLRFVWWRREQRQRQ